jgi:hypothetical protein
MALNGPNSLGQACGFERTAASGYAKNAYKSSLYAFTDGAEMSTGIFAGFYEVVNK